MSDDTLRSRLSDWWFEVRWWARRLVRRPRIRGSDEWTSHDLQALIDAFTPKPGFRPWEIYGDCPLHPGMCSTPYAAKCCFDPVLKVESLDPVMECVTFNEKDIVLSKPRHRFYGPSSNPEMKL